jgi:hypothetical protein
VKHFSKYGLSDSEDEDGDEANVTQLNPNLNQLGGKSTLATSSTAAANKQSIKKLQSRLATTSGETNSDQETSRREKEMIERQLKLIETRRMELMQQHRKGSIGVGGGTAITHQQWELIQEYNVPPPVSKHHHHKASGHIHLDVSDTDDGSASEVAESEDLLDDRDDGEKHIRKALVLDNDEDEDGDETVAVAVDDENKENKEGGIYPSLSAAKKKTAGDRLFPNLNEFKPAGSAFSDAAMHFGNIIINQSIHL